MAYFAMLSGQGWTAIAGCRQFFYARYVDWAFTTPLIILQLGLIAGAETTSIASAIGADGTQPYSNWFTSEQELLAVANRYGSCLREK